MINLEKKIIDYKFIKYQLNSLNENKINIPEITKLALINKLIESKKILAVDIVDELIELCLKKQIEF